MNMPKFYLCLSFLLVHGYLSGQNMVPNPSFEDTVGGTPCYGAIEGAKFWFNPHGATPDYYTFFPNYCGPVSSVNNPSGFQLARTGNAYAGIYSIISPSRDYIAVKLSDTLIAGECYFAELYCSLANLSRYSTNRLGIFFTSDTSGMKLFTTNIPETPQVENLSGNFLSDTMNWMQVSGSFTALGGETFLIIGNFYDDLNTPLDTVFSMSSWLAAYYYIDDIAVIPCDSLSSVDNMDYNNKVSVYPNPAVDKLNITSDNADMDYKSLALYNNVGQRLFLSIEMEKEMVQTIKINVSSLSPGLYNIIFFDINQNSHSFRFIKM